MFIYTFSHVVMGAESTQGNGSAISLQRNYVGNTFPAENAIFLAKMSYIVEHEGTEGTFVLSSLWPRKRDLHVMHIMVSRPRSLRQSNLPKMSHKR
jgi:hypothetical protein